jgi:hypothetical protein
LDANSLLEIHKKTAGEIESLPRCSMKREQLACAAGLVLSFAIFAFAQSESVPAYNQGPPAKGVPLAPIVPRAQRTGDTYAEVYQQVAYDVAQRIPGVLYQLPCYCHCDRIGHNSLRSCFESAHGANCATCMKEAYYAFFEARKGKTPRQIREGIIRGEFLNLDLDQSAQRARKM